jgi:hypothetical protein
MIRKAMHVEKKSRKWGMEIANVLIWLIMILGTVELFKLANFLREKLYVAMEGLRATGL